MSIFKKIFSKDDGTDTTVASSGANTGSSSNNSGITFGRYTDANKTPAKRQNWTTAKNLFTEGKYAECYHTLMDYIKDDELNNVNYSFENGEVTFEITQGSKVVKGKANNQSVTAEANVVRFPNKPSVPVMRKLMNINYTLKYSKFAINENVFCMTFNSSAVDCNPSKLYYALKELATNADKQDDILVDEFSSLESIDTESIIKLNEQEREIKYKYLQQWIESTLNKASTFDPDKFNGAITFLYLSLAYKIDYLLAPEGALTNELEKMQRTYFAKDDKSPIEKNRIMEEGYRNILAKPKEDIVSSFYRVKATFGIVKPSTQKQVADLVYNESNNAKWYIDNGYNEVVLAIYEYMAGYCFFNYGMYQASIELFHMFMHIMNQDFFKELGYGQNYVDANGKPVKTEIEAEINAIINRGKKEFPKLAYSVQYLNYSSMQDFAISFMKEIDYMNFSNE